MHFRSDTQDEVCLLKHNNLMLRSERRERLEAWQQATELSQSVLAAGARAAARTIRSPPVFSSAWILPAWAAAPAPGRARSRSGARGEGVDSGALALRIIDDRHAVAARIVGEIDAGRRADAAHDVAFGVTSATVPVVEGIGAAAGSPAAALASAGCWRAAPFPDSILRR